MTAVVETDWLPYTFTFNYQFTRPGVAHWQAGEPYAQICMVAANLQNSVQPVIRNLSENPQLAEDHEAWRNRRSSLRNRQSAADPAGVRGVWDKDYFLGRYADGRPTEADHKIKLRLKEPIDERQSLCDREIAPSVVEGDT